MLAWADQGGRREGRQPQRTVMCAVVDSVALEGEGLIWGCGCIISILG